jgi:hypothetical protein
MTRHRAPRLFSLALAAACALSGPARADPPRLNPGQANPGRSASGSDRPSPTQPVPAQQSEPFGPPSPFPAPAASDGALCTAAIAAVEHSARLPAALLGSIGLVESGRADPQTGRVTPWPWSINVAGTNHVFETKAAAVAAVEAARAAGVRSIDVGCMQINLMHHPAAFASLDEAFDPAANVMYAAGFLGRLFAQTGGWPQATAAYHSQTPDIGATYARRVMAIWPLAQKYGAAAYLASLPPPGAGPVPGPPAGPTPAALLDPAHVLTPEFRSRLLQDAAADRAALVAMGVLERPVARPTPPGARVGARYVSPLLYPVPGGGLRVGRAHATLTASLARHG